jgi:predicted phosphodiesterase
MEVSETEEAEAPMHQTDPYHHRIAFRALLLVLAAALLAAPVAGAAEAATKPANEPAADATRAAPAAAPKPGFIVRPYLQSPAPTGMVVRWVANSAVTCTVACHQDDRVVQKQYVRSSGPDQADGPQFYRAAFANLKPGTAYEYTVQCGDETFGGAFTTPPVNPKRFTFIAYGDSRTQPDIHREVAARFRPHRPAFILHSGDMVSTGPFPQWPPLFFVPLRGVINRVPMYVTRGNHEGSGRALRRLFELPRGRTWYSFDYGNAHFVALDSCTGRRNRPKMLAWCKDDLAASEATWKIVFYHHPSYDVGAHHTRWGRDDFLPLFRRHGVDLVFTGHSHSYQRFRPLFTKGENEQQPITHVTAAGGGAPLHRVEAGPHTAAARHAYHYCVVEVDGGTLALRAIDIDGTQFDRVTIKKQDGTFDKAYLKRAMPESTFGELAEPLRRLIYPGHRFAERISPKKASPVTLKLGAGPKALRYRITIEERAAPSYEIKPATGTVAAGDVAEVTVHIRPKANVTVGDGGGLHPILRLRCAYEIDGKTGWVYSGRLRCPPLPREDEDVDGK